MHDVDCRQIWCQTRGWSVHTSATTRSIFPTFGNNLNSGRNGCTDENDGRGAERRSILSFKGRHIFITYFSKQVFRHALEEFDGNGIWGFNTSDLPTYRDVSASSCRFAVYETKAFLWVIISASFSPPLFIF